MAFNHNLALLLLLILPVEVERQDGDKQKSAELAAHGGPETVEVLGGVLVAEDGGGHDTADSAESNL